MMDEPLQSFTSQDYQIFNREVLYQGIMRMARYHLRHRLFDGSWSESFYREICERIPAASILLYDPILDRVVLIQQFRTGAIAGENPSTNQPWLLEVVAGLLDHNESAATVAQREAREEAGCEVLDLYPICEYFVSPGGSNEMMSLFCGRIDASNVGDVHGLASEHENIRALTLTTAEAFIWLKEGKIQTSPAIIALQWLQLNRQWLRELWQTK